jgi:hypothetical protein
MSDVGTTGVMVYTSVLLLSLTPIVAAWSGVRWPAVVGVVGLGALTLLFPFGMLIFLPSTCAVLATAIAGPPLRAIQAQSESATIALSDSSR